MSISFSKPQHILVFGLILPALSIPLVFITNWICRQFIHPDYLIFVDTFGVIGAYGFLYSLFDNFVWKWPLLRMLGIVDGPDLSGRWRGTLISSFDGKKEVPAVLEITQTFSAIRVDMYFEKSSSTSLLASFVRERNGQLALHYEYQNDPNEIADETMNVHYGSARLVYVQDRHNLDGTYYNPDRYERGHFGTIRISFQSHVLLHRFSN